MPSSEILSSINSFRTAVELTFKVSIRQGSLVRENFIIYDDSATPQQVEIEPIVIGDDYNSIYKTLRLEYAEMPPGPGEYTITIQNLVNAAGNVLETETISYPYRHENSAIDDAEQDPPEVTVVDKTVQGGLFDNTSTPAETPTPSTSLAIADSTPLQGEIFFESADGVLSFWFNKPITQESLDANMPTLRRKQLGTGYHRWEKLDFVDASVEDGVVYLSMPSHGGDIYVGDNYKYHVIFPAGLQSEDETTLATSVTVEFLGALTPFYLNPDEFISLYGGLTTLEVAEVILRFSAEVEDWFKGDEPPLVAYDYIRAAVECALSRTYEGYGGGEGETLTLGDLSVSNTSTSSRGRGGNDRFGASTPCEMAAVLRNEMRRLARGAGIRTVVAGSNYKSPIPQRQLKNR